MSEQSYKILRSEDPKAAREAFITDIKKGLIATPKRIASIHFYDAMGSRLFDRITRLPEYYPTRIETEILRRHARAISAHINGGSSNLIELGAGCSEKNRIFLDRLLSDQREFTYMPIDISSSAMQRLSTTLIDWFGQDAPPMQGVVGEYFESLEWIKKNAPSGQKKVVLFFGSNIGNELNGLAFLRRLRDSLTVGDLLLIGFDRKKPIEVIHPAYADSLDVTARFNLNVLSRINRELGGNFDTNQFQHHPYYDPRVGGMVSWILSKRKQTVSIRDLGLEVSFDEWQGILTEYSLKYSPQDIAELANKAGFCVLENYSDPEQWFTNSLWVVP